MSLGIDYIIKDSTEKSLKKFNFPTLQLCKLLEKAKGSIPQQYDQFKRLVKYICKNTPPENESKNDNYVKNFIGFNYEIDEPSGMIQFLDEMLDEEGHESINYLLKEIDIFLDMNELEITNVNPSDSYIINIYTMLLYHHCRPKDKNGFHDIVEDLKKFFASFYGDVLYVNYYSLMAKKLFKYMTYSPEVGKILTSSILMYDRNEMQKMYSCVTNTIDFISDLKNNKKELESSGYDIGNIDEEITSFLLSNIKVDKDNYANTILKFNSKYALIGDCFEYLIKNTYKAEPNPGFRLILAHYLNKLIDTGLFEKINASLDISEDCFKTIMANIFDSDSYKEIVNKVTALNEINSLFEKDSDAALNKLKEFPITDYKGNVGIRLTYPEDSNNLIRKPEAINDRTKEILMMYPNTFDEKAITESFFELKIINKFLDNINSIINYVNNAISDGTKKTNALEVVEPSTEISTEPTKKKKMGLWPLKKSSSTE